MKAKPAPHLAAYVDYYWMSRWDRRGQPARTASALLDPCVHLQVGDSRAEIMGVSRGTFQVQLADAGYVIGARFRPGGLYPFVQQPVSQWTDRTVSAGEVFRDVDARQFPQAMRAAVADCTGDADAHGEIIKTHLDALLASQLPPSDEVAKEMAELVALVATASHLRRVPDLARVCGRSERTLHRLFLRYVGVSPAWVIRRYRLHAAAQRLTAYPSTDVGALAHELGYADQAHFIRDFRATIGMTPGTYVGTRS